MGKVWCFVFLTHSVVCSIVVSAVYVPGVLSTEVKELLFNFKI